MPAFPTRAAVALLVALSLVGCAARSRTAPPASAADAALAAFHPTIVAENGGGEWLDVYLVHERGEWYLGRVAPGAKVALSLPTTFRSQPTGMVRLAVLVGTTRSIQPSRDPRALLTVPQPIGTLMGQQWTFAQGQLTGRLEHPR